ncbi:MAG: FprA family A-type flavoprotein [Coriobacteriia bacterium]
MRAVPVSDGIWWVGAVDWNLRDFHGYETPRGTTYNAYLVKGENTWALIDTVKTAFVPELLSRVAEIVEPAKVGLIVVNHVEPDHNSGLRDVMEAMPDARVVASGSGVKGVAEYHNGLVVDPVGAADVIDLGGRTLHFLPAPMVHWPDSMFTYCPEAATLMPNDAFGQHLASSGRFADEVGLDLAIEELGIYYANILMPVGSQVAKMVGKIAEAGWEPAVVAPSHGVIWRAPEFAAAVAAYERWNSGVKRDKAVVAFSTMWDSTRMLAHAITDGITAEGVEVDMYDLAVTPGAHITYELLEAKALVLGSPTLHHGMLYRVAGYIQYLTGLKPTGRLAAFFGSYGWGGGAIKQMRELVTGIGLDAPLEDFGVKFKPTPEDLIAAEAWGREVALAIKALP